MKQNIKNSSFYLLVVGCFSLLMYLIVKWGEPQEAFKVTILKIPAQAPALEQISNTLHHNVTHPLAILILQIITIIISARAFGFLLKKIGQPTVIGEIIAGILLGPSFVGHYFPEFSAFLFPKASLGNLQFFSQIGLIFFMFIIGMELDLKILRKKAHEALIISHASIIIPFALGMGLALFMYMEYAPANVMFLPFSLFIGISLSITAFPVLARIVQERQLTKTKLGTIALTCAAVDDITAWCILAAVIAIVKAGSAVSAIYTVLLAAVFVIIMMKLIRPFLKRMGDIYSHQDTLSKPVVAVFFITLLLSAYTAEVIGIHALFGAFLAGAIMPQNIHFRNVFIEKVEDVSVVVFLPLFFVLTGLRTEIGLLNDPGQWKMCALITGLAIAGKFVGSALAAKFVRQSWRNSLIIGALMNTRGLMELVVLNIGFDLGILSPQVFAMMVIMALVTTFMTGPALDFINFIRPPKELEEDELMHKRFRILFSFGNAESGKNMVRVAGGLTDKNEESALVTALHLASSNEVHPYEMKELERESFKPVKREANKQNLPVQTLLRLTADYQKEIVHVANEGNYDLLLVGLGQSIYEGSLLGRWLDITRRIINPENLYKTITGKERMLEENGFDAKTNILLKSVKCRVGILAGKGPKKLDNILFISTSPEDAFMLEFVQKFREHGQAQVSVIEQGMIVNDELISKADMVLVSAKAWQEFLEKEPAWLSNVPAMLIVR